MMKTMKKMFLTAVVALMATVSAYAQNGYDDTKHEIAISYGGGSNSQILDVFENAIAYGFVGYRFNNERTFGPISVEYFNHVKPWLGVGGIFVYGQNKRDAYSALDNDKKDGELLDRYFTVMPAVKFDWLRKKHFGLYSKLGVGVTLRHENYDNTNEEFEDHKDPQLHVNWQATVVGIEAGGPRVRGFLEAGFGEQGIFSAGVRYKF